MPTEVCSECFSADCWQGRMYCDNYRAAGVVMCPCDHPHCECSTLGTGCTCLINARILQIEGNITALSTVRYPRNATYPRLLAEGGKIRRESVEQYLRRTLQVIADMKPLGNQAADREQLAAILQAIANMALSNYDRMKIDELKARTD